MQDDNRRKIKTGPHHTVLRPLGRNPPKEHQVSGLHGSSPRMETVGVHPEVLVEDKPVRFRAVKDGDCSKVKRGTDVGS